MKDYSMINKKQVVEELRALHWRPPRMVFLGGHVISHFIRYDKVFPPNNRHIGVDMPLQTIVLKFSACAMLYCI